MLEPSSPNHAGLFHRLQLLSLLLLVVTCCVISNFPLRVTGQLDHTLPTNVVKQHATGRQREQLLQLRSIITKALKAYPNGSHESPNSAIDGKVPIEAKSTTRKKKHWWLSKPFFISSITAGCVSLAILALLCIACSPFCNSIDCRCRQGFSSGEKNDYGEGSSDGGSLYKEAAVTDCPSPYGIIRYQMTYNQEKEHLTVVVKGCTDLPRNALGSLNPYILVRIVGKDGTTALGETEATATPVERGTTSPEFNFPCSFKLVKADLPKVTVKFEVYDRDESSKEPALIARCRHVLEDPRIGREVDDLLLYSASDEEHVFHRRLKRGTAPDLGPGEICVRLSRGAGEEAQLLVRVIECKGVYLRQSRGQLDKRNPPNTYVELMLMEPNGPIHTRRSDTVEKSRNPYFNEEFSFPAMSADRLRQSALRFSLVHVSDFLRLKQAVGSVELSADDEEDPGDRRFRLARDHWLTVTESKSKQPVTKCSWHCLMEPDEEMRLRRAQAMKAKE